MISSVWSFYGQDGLFIDQQFTGPESSLSINTPNGTIPLLGEYDNRSQRIDLSVLAAINELDPSNDAEQIAQLKTALVVDYQPPQPSDDHEWNADTKRWQIKPEIEDKRQRSAQALEQLQALDAKESRAVSDVIADPTDEQAKARLADIRSQKEALRELRRTLT